ncbi:hypothetical protein Y032_1153g3704 [Ancylostoma ceylanicum]|uniref:Uncharacterized protein n=1 Tax=Ancylostoma ceylanicum TaxID=53326 RepID=A0A016W6A2_9BILA|nr:hypothetical protein Y032_1153g3704 [Ancylostoma ceylanicum]
MVKTQIHSQTQLLQWEFSIIRQRIMHTFTNNPYLKFSPNHIVAPTEILHEKFSFPFGSQILYIFLLLRWLPFFLSLIMRLKISTSHCSGGNRFCQHIMKNLQLDFL